jgi:hypothetical protein
MDGAWLARARWRRRGAWMWPAFILTTLLDGVIGHALPPAGETQSLLGAALLGCFINLGAVVLLSHPAGVLLRRRRRDMPKVVARDYGGTVSLFALTGLLLLVGLIHRPSVLAHARIQRDAIVRAEAWIGARAPDEFRRRMTRVNVYAIEPGNIYRVCMPSAVRVRTYCVVVKTRLPLAQSVSFAGYEPNSVFAAGTG